MNTYAFCFTAIPHGSDPLRRQMDPSLYQTLLVPCNLTGKFDRYAPEIAGTAGLLRVVEVEFGGKTAWVPADCLRGPDGEAVDLEWMLNHTLADIANVSLTTIDAMTKGSPPEHRHIYRTQRHPDGEEQPRPSKA